MASVSKKGNGYFIRVYVGGQGKQVKFYGFTDKRVAGRVGDKIEALVTAQKTGDTPPELAVWVSKLAASDSALYAKLAAFGLVEPVEETHTLAELVEKHRLHLRGVVKQTLENIKMAEANLIEFFGDGCELDKITAHRADDFVKWLRTAPLNRRRKTPAAYSEATVNRRVKRVKQIFTYAKRIGWVTTSPFEYVQGGESVNPEKWVYVNAETAIDVIDAAGLPKWRAILALGRFAGVRGSSELYGLKWEHVQWSSGEQAGQLIIMAEKNKRHGRKFRTVPLHPIVERELSTLFMQATECETHVFPGMKKKTNFGTMTENQIVAAGVPLWVEPWYNLRRSFCCDLMEAGVDPVTYEAITDHTYTVALKHYQIPHTKRLQKGYEAVLESWGLITDTENKRNAVKTGIPRGLEKGLVGGLKGGLHCTASDSGFSRQGSPDPCFYDSTREKENPTRNDARGDYNPVGAGTGSSGDYKSRGFVQGEKGRGLKKGLVGAEKEIFRLFDCLDSDCQQWVLERLAEMVEVVK